MKSKCSHGSGAAKSRNGNGGAKGGGKGGGKGGAKGGGKKPAFLKGGYR